MLRWNASLALLAKGKSLDAGRVKVDPVVFIIWIILLLLQQNVQPLVTYAAPLPFALLHGFDNSCQGNDTLRNLQFMQESSGVIGVCVEVGGGVNSSIFMSMWDQVHYACHSLSTNPLFANGFNLVGLSQGGLIARAVIQTCDTLPPVHNFIAAASPQAGQASIPFCMSAMVVAPCRLVNRGIKMRLAYRPWLQRTFAPAGYYKAPTRLKQYLKGCSFLPVINNEVHVNATYIERLTRINQMVLIMFENDNVIFPRESSHFRFFAENSYSMIPPLNATDMYIRDTIGLKTLVENRKVVFLQAPGKHLGITREIAQSSFAPYLTA